MAGIIRAVDLPVLEPSGLVYFELLQSIVSQQLSVKAAETIFNRVLDMFPDRYPHPEWVLEIPTEQLRAAGLSYQKAGYFRNVAQYAMDKDLESIAWEKMDDEAIIALLGSIKGVGKWTVQMILIFTLGRPDVFPLDDFGIQQGMIRLFQLQEAAGRPLKNKMQVLSEPWQPYRSLAARYLWHWKDGAPA